MIIGIRNSVLQRIPIKAACNGYYLRWWYNGWHYWFFLPGDHTINTEGERYFTLSTRTITMSSGQVTREQAAAIRTIFFTKEVYLLGIAGWMEIRIEPGSPVIYNNMVAGTEIEITAHIGSREISYTSGYTPVPDLPIVAPSEPVMCELIIGTQIWACYNVETDYPGSKVYGEDEANRSVFGGLYNWTQIMASGFCPEGWHVPTLAEWQTLIDFLGGDATAGGHLKSIEASHWNAPNTGADDSVGFNARGAGVGLIDYWTHLISYAGQKGYAYLWTADDEPTSPSTHARVIRMTYDSAEVIKTYGNKLTEYLSVRLIKNIIPSLDYIVIGTQTWKIANVNNNIFGSKVYGGNESNRDIYGGLYTWDMIPAIEALYPGWHVPTLTEWETLFTFVGGNTIAGGKLKEVGITHWNSPNTGATNEFGFTALPGGYYDDEFAHAFAGINTDAVFWTNSEFDVPGGPHAYCIGMGYNYANIVIPYMMKISWYFSIRLIKD